MPIYEYECTQCKEKFELLHLTKADEETACCPKCQAADVTRVLSVFSSGAGESADVGCGPSGST